MLSSDLKENLELKYPPIPCFKSMGISQSTAEFNEALALRKNCLKREKGITYYESEELPHISFQ